MVFTKLESMNPKGGTDKRSFDHTVENALHAGVALPSPARHPALERHHIPCV